MVTWDDVVNYFLAWPLVVGCGILTAAACLAVMWVVNLFCHETFSGG